MSRRQGRKGAGARWSWSAGEYGGRVRVFEGKNGWLYATVPLERPTGERPRYRKLALKHRDHERGKGWAKDQAERLAAGWQSAADDVPTVARVFAAYRTARTDADLSPTSRYIDERCGGRPPDHNVPGDRGDPGLFVRVFGADRDLSKLTLGEWEHFIRLRQTGAVDAWGRPVSEPVTPTDPKRRAVRARTVEADCEWLAIVCNWAMEWEDRHTGKPLLREHPLKRERFRDAVPHEQNPRRPVATQDRLEAILGQSGNVHPFLPQLLVIVNGTGRRINAVLQLRYQDLRLAKSAAAPYGAIQWPGETDKTGKAWSAPINATVRETLDTMLSERPGLGGAYLFPAPADPAKPMNRWFASKLLQKAERLAKVGKQSGSLWHAYRRKWGTERKHLPVQDVAQAGGWKNTATLETIYQQPDDATMYTVVSQPMELREAQQA